MSSLENNSYDYNARNNTPYSQLKVFFHNDVLQNLMNNRRCAPIYVRIKPTNRCNHDCNYCHYKSPYLRLDEYKINDQIPRDKMLEIVEDMSDIGVKAVTFSGGGEPLLYPYIEETMGLILEKGIDLSIITNGSLLNGKKAELLGRAKWVRISIDSIRDEQYCKIRGIRRGAFDALCENIRNFSVIKTPNCELGVNFVVSKDNHLEVYDIAELMKSLGVNHVKYSPLISNDTLNYHAVFKEQVSKDIRRAGERFNDDRFRVIDLYTSDFGDSVVFERRYNKCPIKEFVCVIGANSKVYYCHDKAYLSNGCVGDISYQSFKNMWFSKETDELFKSFDARQICKQHCVYDSRNELIGSFLEMDKNHINFI